MKKHKLIGLVYDVISIFLLRMKLICKDFTTLASMTTSLIIFSIIIHALSVSVEEQSSLPIGILDKDKSVESEELMERLNNVTTLKLISNEDEELHKLLLDEMILGLFVIENGYEEKLKRGDINDIITMYYLEGNKSASILSDIIASEMIYPISFYKSYRYYDKIPFEGRKHTKAEYEAYLEKLFTGSEDFDFAFDMKYINPDIEVSSEKVISNSLLYNQLIFGILGILIAFIAMFLISQTVREKEMGIGYRLRITRFQPYKQDVGNFLALIFCEGSVALIFSSLIYSRLETKELSLFISSFILILLNAIVFGGFFIVISKLVKSIILYQLIGSIIILLLGGLGFYRLLTGFYQTIADRFLKFIPNNWFIQGFTDIIVYGNKDSYWKEAHQFLLLIAVAVILLIMVLNIIIPMMNKKQMNFNDRMER
ncbi:ABC transporter permease [Mobilitalea sibirica]|uniref:ABC transporter permease n=1 Tax=Mobilitalea sibirica TaxID=1462919 RepID=A0A8J7H0M0_9FIRM|nr:ABC transporter permease [Mobilitalea sibirica]MBH1939688.1 ABC transporter permease [Mobilitalea sibirica]